jgi:hypothetical protein
MKFTTVAIAASVTMFAAGTIAFAPTLMRHSVGRTTVFGAPSSLIATRAASSSSRTMLMATPADFVREQISNNNASQHPF